MHFESTSRNCIRPLRLSSGAHRQCLTPSVNIAIAEHVTEQLKQHPFQAADFEVLVPSSNSKTGGVYA